jgi:hypothetical protein
MSWSKGYDYVLGSARLLSATTNMQRDGVTQEILLRGNGLTRQHLFFRSQPGVPLWGGTRLRSGGQHVGGNEPLSTESAPLIARVEAIYKPKRDEYDLRFLPLIEASTVSSTAWSALKMVSRETRTLPGEYGRSGLYEVRVLPFGLQGVPSTGSHTAYAAFGPNTPTQFSIEWKPL